MNQSEVATEMVQMIPVLMRKVHGYMRCNNESMASAHFRLLAILAKRSMTMTELADKQAISTATMSNSVSTLVEKGWVKRMPSPQDRRIIMVEITDLGREKLHEIDGHLHSSIKNSLKALSAEDLEQVGTGLRILHKLLAAEKPAGCRPSQEKEVNDSTMKQLSRKK